MQKQSCAFSELDHAENSWGGFSQSFTAGILCLLLGVVSPSWASPESQLESDLEAVNTAFPVHVGDRVTLQPLGFKPGNGAIKITVDRVTPLEREGWLLKEDEYLGTQFVIIPMKAGRLVLPSLRIIDSSTKVILRTHPFILDVSSVISKEDPEPNRPADPIPPLGLAFPTWIVVCIFVVLLVLGGFLGWIVYSKYKKKLPVEIVVPTVNPLSPEEVALRALIALEKGVWIQEREFKNGYFKISEILKSFFGARFGFHAAESTTEELLTIVSRHHLLKEDGASYLSELFKKLDRVKFTDHLPQDGEPSLLIKEAETIVQMVPGKKEFP